MHLAALRKNSVLALHRLVDLTECYARWRVSEADAAVAALAENDQSFSLESLEDLPHDDRVGPEAFRDCLRSGPLVAGVSDETHDVDGAGQSAVGAHNRTVVVTFKAVKLRLGGLRAVGRRGRASASPRL